ncbi:ABC transporter permease [Vulcanimicrobium alpinum]|uniref:ABC transporter permease n=1 Tax=Vulcanimicrobium alpinum TaxID=3016050 RepID=A0AAN2C870_UNVUL|nr:ABC transporter permease [Vulcanimicrobium alpinum]BDE05310.1 ABC transporter permease [Vulcanimicrobium alpinum]
MTDVKAVMDARAGDAVAKKRREATLRNGGLAIGFVVLVFAVNALTHGAFLTAGNLTNVLRQITVNAIMAVGQTFVIITAGIDLSVGSIVGLGGVVAALTANALHLPAPLAFVVTLLAALAVGSAAGWINALPVVKLGLPPFITTLAMMQVARGLAYILAHGQPIPLNDSDPFTWLGTGTFFSVPGFTGIPYQVVVMLIVVFAFALLLGRTVFGRYVLALGGNEEAARLAGVNTSRMKTLVYVISGGLSALAGLVLMSRFASGGPQTGTGYELQAIAAVVVGGTSLMGGRGTIVGTFFGALLIGVLNNVMNLLNIESYTQMIVLGIVILLALVLDALRKRWVASH